MEADTAAFRGRSGPSGAQAAGNRRLRDHRGAGRGRDDPLFLRQPRTSDDAAGAGIVETILEGRQPPKMTLAALMWPLPCLWQEQVRAHLQGNTASELPFNPSGCRSIGIKRAGPGALIAFGLSDDRRPVLTVFILVVFLVFVIIVAGISWRHRIPHDRGEKTVDPPVGNGFGNVRVHVGSCWMRRQSQPRDVGRRPCLVGGITFFGLVFAAGPTIVTA